MTDLVVVQLGGVHCPLTVSWSETERVAGDEGLAAGNVADLWIPAAEAKSTDTLLPFLAVVADCDGDDGNVSAGMAEVSIPVAVSESTDTLLQFLT